MRKRPTRTVLPLIGRLIGGCIFRQAHGVVLLVCVWLLSGCQSGNGEECDRCEADADCESGYCVEGDKVCADAINQTVCREGNHETFYYGRPAPPILKCERAGEEWSCECSEQGAKCPTGESPCCVVISTRECWCTDEGEDQCQQRVRNTRVDRVAQCPP